MVWFAKISSPEVTKTQPWVLPFWVIYIYFLKVYNMQHTAVSPSPLHQNHLQCVLSHLPFHQNQPQCVLSHLAPFIKTTHSVCCLTMPLSSKPPTMHAVSPCPRHQNHPQCVLSHLAPFIKTTDSVKHPPHATPGRHDDRWPMRCVDLQHNGWK